MFVTQRVEALAYDGTNGQFIASEWLANVTLVSDNGQLLVLEVPGWPSPSQIEVPLAYLVLRGGRKTFMQPIPAEDFAENWVQLPDPPPAP